MGGDGIGRIWIALGSLAGLVAVAMAAAAAHGLPERLDPAALGLVRDAVQMQSWHAPALLACGIWASRGGRLAQLAGLCFTLGLLLFCGELYAHALAGLRVPLVAPMGGTLLMAGWALLGLSAIFARQ